MLTTQRALSRPRLPPRPGATVANRQAICKTRRRGPPHAASTPSRGVDAPPPTAPPPPHWRWDESDDAVRTYGVLLGVLAAGPPAAGVFGSAACLPYFLALAASTIYAGAHRGLTSRARAPLGLTQSALLPVCAAGGLGTVYLVLTYTHVDLTTLLRLYFFLLSAVALTAAAAPPLRHVTRGAGLPRWRVDVPPGWLVDGEGQGITAVDVAPTDVLAAAAGVAVAAADAATGHTNFTLSNLCAVAVCADVVRLLGFRSFRAAGAALVGLALYDVCAVFATSHWTSDGQSVMAAVATSDALAGPTRLLFPRDGVAAFPHSLLGLGDVAVPGIFAALALRFDASRAVDMPARAAAAAAAIDAALADLPKTLSDREIGDVAADAAAAAYDGVADTEQAARDAAVGEGASAARAGGGAAAAAPTEAALASRPYFFAVVTAYAVGLAAAFGVNAATGAGQPALLYLVPATLGGAAVLAAARGDVARLAAFTDAGPSILEADK